MNPDENPSDTEKEIRLYLLDQLPPPEKEAVEARIAQDPDYARAVEDLRWMLSLAQVARHDRMRAQVQAAGVRAQAGAGPRWRRGVYLSAAAAVALLAAFGVYWWVRPPLGKRLFKEKFERYPLFQITQGAASDSGFMYYRDSLYDSAIVALSAIPKEDSAYAEARFYLAQSHMVLDETPAAVVVLEALLETQRKGLLKLPMEEALVHEAEWYLALGYLDVGRMAAAKELLERLSALPNAPKKVGEILGALR